MEKNTEMMFFFVAGLCIWNNFCTFATDCG